MMISTILSKDLIFIKFFTEYLLICLDINIIYGNGAETPFPINFTA